MKETGLKRLLIFAGLSVFLLGGLIGLFFLQTLAKQHKLLSTGYSCLLFTSNQLGVDSVAEWSSERLNHHFHTALEMQIESGDVVSLSAPKKPSGFYTAKQSRELYQYATKHDIEIIASSISGVSMPVSSMTVFVYAKDAEAMRAYLNAD